MKFAEKIKELRTEHHYTQKELANLLDVKPTTISAWELGTNLPRMDMIQKISNLFNVDIDCLFDTSKSKAKKTLDLDDEDAIFTYEGRKIPKEDIELMKRLLRGKKED